jgi:phage tail-like protein
MGTDDAEGGIPANAGFRVEIDGLAGSIYESVGGIGVDVEALQFLEGQDNLIAENPGRYKARDLQLTRRFVGRDGFHEWLRQARSGVMVQKRSGSILVLRGDGQEIARINFFRAWPKSWSGPQFAGDRDGAAFLTETFTLSIDDIEVVSG